MDTEEDRLAEVKANIMAAEETLAETEELLQFLRMEEIALTEEGSTAYGGILMDTKEMLDQLAELRTGRDLMETPYRMKMAELNAEMVDKTDEISTEIAELEAKIKAVVLNAGATVKSQYLQAVYSKPRVSWDTRALDGYAKANPDVLAFRKTGKSSVSIRTVK